MRRTEGTAVAPGGGDGISGPARSGEVPTPAQVWHRAAAAAGGGRVRRRCVWEPQSPAGSVRGSDADERLCGKRRLPVGCGRNCPHPTNGTASAACASSVLVTGASLAVFLEDSVTAVTAVSCCHLSCPYLLFRPVLTDPRNPGPGPCCLLCLLTFLTSLSPAAAPVCVS